MKYAIIAAGEGSRLAQEGIRVPKPLVKIHGEHLIDRLMAIFLCNNAEEIVVICNDLTPEVSEHLAEIQANGLYGVRVPLRYVVKSTPSSMHSFHEISRFLDDKPFVLTTVDTIFRKEEFAEYIRYFEAAAGSCDGVMGVTDYIDDEKPLYVSTRNEERETRNEVRGTRYEVREITGFLDSCDNPHYISGGIYGLTPKAIATLKGCMERGESRMRNFQRALLRDGLKLKAFPFSKVLDIDHASDIEKAETFVNS